jgi:alpha-L-rhamnosidase
VNASPTDYTVEATIEVVHNAAGLIFAGKDAQNFYMWQFNTEQQGNPRFRPHRWQQGNPALLDAVGIGSKVSIVNGQPFRVRIDVSGGQLARTYINNVLIDERRGDFEFGLIGMRMDYGDDRQVEQAYFDDLSITTPDGNVLFAEDFTSANSFSAGSVVDGRLYVEGTGNGHVLSWQQQAGQHLHYIVETDMTLLHHNAAIVFAATSTNTYHMWQVNTLDHAQYPMVRRHIYNNGQLSYNEAPFTQFSKADILNHRRHLKIEVLGNLVTTSIDGTVVDTYTDASGVLASGDVGFRVDNSGSNYEEAYFDNLVVTSFAADGTATVVLSEDFEQGVSDYFFSANVVERDSGYELYMNANGRENRLMQSATDGIPMFRKEFELTGTVSSAKLFTAAQGVYDLFINGQRVGHVQPDGTTVYEELKPGWSDYRHRIFYTTHDVTSLLQQGANALGAVVASGWFAGTVGHGMYGSESDLGIIAKLVVTYDDGRQETIVSDLSWASSKRGAIRMGDIYNGEIYDARLESDWTRPGYDQSAWNSVAVSQYFNGQLEPIEGQFIQTLPNLNQKVRVATISEGVVATGSDFGKMNVVETRHSPAAISLKKGQTVVLDFGQNIVGWVQFTVRGQRGTRLHIQPVEMLNDTGERSRGNDGPGGSPYLANLRSAKAELYYTLAGREGGETYHPSMTFYGFRYAQVRTTGDVEFLAMEAVPVSSSVEDAATLTTSSSMVNQLYSNIQWGQRGNLLSVPTDCPQRDERQGWTGDTQVFARTAMYNAQTQTFYHKWMTDMRDGQRGDGAFPDTAPIGYAGFGSSAWADAGIIVPWTVYQMYGDKQIIEENYEAMERYMQFLAAQKGDGYNYQGAYDTYGDWLAFADTDKRYICVAYYAQDAMLMAKMARALSTADGDEYAQKAEQYETLFANIKAEFQSRYFTPSPRMNSQTALLLALRFGLTADEQQWATVRDRLSAVITRNKETLSTGFVGTAILNQTLSQCGLNDHAYNLLLQRRCPSWLYSVDQGATTTWERWNSYTVEAGFGDPGMNSFNHYAYGAVAEWMLRYMAGIDTDERQPGFKHILLQPMPDFRQDIPDGQESIDRVSATHNSPYGIISSEWKRTADGISYMCTVPANTTATLRLPVKSETTAVVADVESAGYADGCRIYELGSGTYTFSTDVSSGVTSANHQRGTADDSIYDLNGRQRVTAAPAGLYIVGSRKLAVK